MIHINIWQRIIHLRSESNAFAKMVHLVDKGKNSLELRIISLRETAKILEYKYSDGVSLIPLARN